MLKFIVRAESDSDNVNLLKNTEATIDSVTHWSSSVTKCTETPPESSVTHLLEWVALREWKLLDDALMGFEVPTGSMVVVVQDRYHVPLYGFVCGNDSKWFAVRLPFNVRDAIIHECERTNEKASLEKQNNDDTSNVDNFKVGSFYRVQIHPCYSGEPKKVKAMCVKVMKTKVDFVYLSRDFIDGKLGKVKLRRNIRLGNWTGKPLYEAYNNELWSNITPVTTEDITTKPELWDSVPDPE